MSQEPLKIQFPSQGWKQFLTARKKMLDGYDAAKTSAIAHKTETFHGRVAEGLFREWLSSFLPKRYGVTSGYIISLARKYTEKLPHFDVIIYDQLETPILWVENNPDSSEQGKSLAIPVENVLAIIEVKARFTTRSVNNALVHLSELRDVMSGRDDVANRYKVYLPPNFFCGLVFFEMYEKDAYSKVGLNKITQYDDILRRFWGGTVLRGEGLSEYETGRISMGRSETPVSSINGKGKNKISLLKWGMSDTIEKTDKNYTLTMLHWAEAHFASFAFDMLALLNGSYDGRVSSFYGMGSSYMEAPKSE